MILCLCKDVVISLNVFFGYIDTFHNSVSGVHRIFFLLISEMITYTDAIVMCFELISPHNIIEMEE